MQWLRIMRSGVQIRSNQLRKRVNSMKDDSRVHSVLFAGVGGQGIIRASDIMCMVMMVAGYDVKKSEVHGMAQRGGSVTSQVRLGGEGLAPSIPLRKADLILGFEPAEVLRNFAYLKPQGAVVVNINPIRPVTSSLGQGYALEEILAYLRKNAGRAIFVDGDALCTAAGSAKVLNVIMLGVLTQEKLLPFSRQQLLETMLKHVPAKFKTLNEKAFNVGFAYKEDGDQA